jgi:PKD repeat protein
MILSLRRSIVLSVALGGTLAGGHTLVGDVVVPSTAFLVNGIGDDFRTDVRVFNPTGSPVVVTPVFYRQANASAGISPDTVTAPDVTVPARGQTALDNVLVSLFGQSSGAFGPIRFQTTAPVVVSSATNNVNGCNHTGAIQGQWIPGLDVSAAVTHGTLVQLAASTSSTSGYRSNLVFFNPASSGSANVTANLRSGDGTLVSTATFTLGNGPAGFRQINRFSSDFSPQVSLSDTNLWVEFTSDQPVLAFASVINNLSGDPYALSANGDAGAGSPAPVASYSVSASPTAGQPVTFTDTSSGSPTLLLWSFGDGATATSGSLVQHSYAAAGTFRTAHFAGNAAGVSGAEQDVVVAAVTPATIKITITASQWKWTPQNVDLKVGQPYEITFQTDPAVPSIHHGVGGPAGLGSLGPPADCFFLNPSCVWKITPTANLLNSPGPVYQYGCTQSTCGFGHTNMTAGGPMGGTITIVP